MSCDWTRPPGGNRFEAVEVEPEGWLCLAPWVKTPDGCWWRPHLELQVRSGEKGRIWAKHYAEQINAAMGHGDAPTDPMTPGPPVST